MSNNDTKIAEMPAGLFHHSLKKPPAWMVVHAHKYGNVLARLLTHRNMSTTERWQLMHEWVHVHKADISCAVEDRRGRQRFPHRPAQHDLQALWRNTPLGMAVVMGEAECVSAMLPSEWSPQHEAMFALALMQQQEEIAEKIWAFAPALHRISGIGLEHVLWSKVWTKRFLERGMSFSQELTSKVLTNCLGTHMVSSVQDMRDIFERFERIDDARHTIVRRVRGQTAGTKVNWDGVLEWAFVHALSFSVHEPNNAREILNVAIQWIKHRKFNPAQLMMCSGVLNKDWYVQKHLLEELFPLVPPKQYKELFGAMVNNGLLNNSSNNVLPFVGLILTKNSMYAWQNVLDNPSHKLRANKNTLDDVRRLVQREILQHVVDQRIVDERKPEIAVVRRKI